MHYTGSDASQLKGNFQCCSCNRIITMKGNYKDRLPPCPYEKKGTYYTKTQLSKNNNLNFVLNEKKALENASYHV